MNQVDAEFGGHSTMASLHRPVRGVVFDLDGTLLDTEPLYRHAFHAALEDVGWQLPDAEYDRLIGLPSTERRMQLPVMLGCAFPAARFFTCYYARRAALLADGTPLKPGVWRLLDLLDELGLPFAIATSASATTAHANLKAAGLLHRFDIVVTRDHVAHGKPAPDVFIMATDRLRLTAGDCLAVEDSRHGVAAAHRAGLMVAMVPDLCAPDLCDPDLPGLGSSVVVVRSLQEVGALLARSGREPARETDRSHPRA